MSTVLRITLLAITIWFLAIIAIAAFFLGFLLSSAPASATTTAKEAHAANGAKNEAFIVLLCTTELSADEAYFRIFGTPRTERTQ